MMKGSANMRRSAIGGVLIGIGLGGFFDGILLHQILQWHHMLSALHPPRSIEAMQTNVLWDGLFHAFSWIATSIGIFLLWTGAHESKHVQSAPWLVGVVLIGWGLFNITEGLVHHHILGIHHVRDWGANALWDFGFLLSGPVLIGFGWIILRASAGRKETG